MNSNPDPANVNRASGAALGYLAACAMVFVLVAAVKSSIRAPAIDADRAAAISKALSEIRANEVTELNHAGWVDQSRGIVRLPIATAMKFTEREWQNPAQARADLIAREEKATTPLPEQPAKPSAFE